MLKNRLVRLPGEQGILFEIHSFYKSMRQFAASRVYDSNGFLLLQTRERNTLYLSTKTIINQMYILDEEEEKKERKEMQSIRRVMHVVYYLRPSYYSLVSCVILDQHSSVHNRSEYRFENSDTALARISNSDFLPIKFLRKQVDDINEPEPKEREFIIWTSKTPASEINFVHLHAHGIEELNTAAIKFENLDESSKSSDDTQLANMLRCLSRVTTSRRLYTMMLLRSMSVSSKRSS